MIAGKAASSNKSLSPFLLRRFSSTFSLSSSSSSSSSHSTVASASRYQLVSGHRLSRLRSLTSGPSWLSLGSDLRSRVSVRSQIATSSSPTLVERFHRQIATMGINLLFFFFFFFFNFLFFLFLIIF